MLWNLSAARQSGFVVSNRLDKWLDWAIDASLTVNDQGKTLGSTNKEGVAQILMSLEFADGARRQGKSADGLARIIRDGQEPEGCWTPGGQLPSQKRAISETTDVTTTWLALALRCRVPADLADAAIDSAMQHIEKSPPGKSTEWYATRLLLAQRLKDEQTAAKFAGDLRTQQQADGGWGWIVGEDSDALGTGMSLYALIHWGVDRNDPVIKRAQRFLLETQREDGSWSVKGTKAGKKDSVEETAVYWGTTWPTLGLIASLRN